MGMEMRVQVMAAGSAERVPALSMRKASRAQKMRLQIRAAGRQATLACSLRQTIKGQPLGPQVKAARSRETLSRRATRDIRTMVRPGGIFPCFDWALQA